MINENCIKCGYDKSRLTYHGHKAYIQENTTLCGSEIIAVTELSHKEVIEVCCVRCNYTWFEKPLDVRYRKEKECSEC